MQAVAIWESRYHIFAVHRRVYKLGDFISIFTVIDDDYTDITLHIKKLLSLSPNKSEYIYINGRTTAHSIIIEYLTHLKRKHHFTGRIPSQFALI